MKIMIENQRESTLAGLPQATEGINEQEAIRESFTESAQRIAIEIADFCVAERGRDPHILSVFARNLKTESGDIFVTATRIKGETYDERQKKGVAEGDFRLWTQRPHHHQGHYSGGKGLVIDVRAPYRDIEKELLTGLGGMECKEKIETPTGSYVDESTLYVFSKGEKNRFR